MMFLAAEFAAQKALSINWDTPFDLLKALIPETCEFAKKISRNPDIRLTFILNSLVALDNAAWLLYSRTKGISSFDDMIPETYKPALSARHDTLVTIPLISYGVSIESVRSMLADGYCFLKIKIGSDPEKDGNLDKMLEWDMRRLSEIHEAAGRFESPHTESGRILYYLDANGRYDSIKRVEKLLRHAKKIGALDRIIVLEEPFPEEMKIAVSGIAVRIAADESAHSEDDIEERIALGYRAIALKPIAKTLSMSLKMAKTAKEKNIPCFCADLTVNPILVDWNKNVAARLERLPGMKTGVVESNGHQNYKNWDAMLSMHPCRDKARLSPVKGVFKLGSEFYSTSGGIYEESGHYAKLFPK
jgi:hypothetical protein